MDWLARSWANRELTTKVLVCVLGKAIPAQQKQMFGWLLDPIS